MSEHLHTIPARIVKAGQQRQLADVDLPDGVQPYFWQAEISNNRLDFYYGHMAESTLRNFANDASAGVSFLDSHNSRALGYGQSIMGTFEETGEQMRTVAEFYTVPGIAFSGGVTYASTDAFILAIRSGLTRDVSVGFYGGQQICDICGEDVWEIDWDAWAFRCPHIPGMEYGVGDQGNEVVVATFEVQDAHLAEVSAVYDGATPGAEIIGKAERLLEAGQLSALQVDRFERRYRIKLAQPDKRWAGYSDAKEKLMSTSKTKRDNETTTSPAEETTKENTEETTETGEETPEAGTETPTQETTVAAGGEEEARQIRAILTETNAPDGSLVDKVRWLIAENARLATLADQGRQYHSDLIEEAIVEGVRAMGDNFPVETYRNMFASASIETIKQLRDAWAKQAGGRFTGGRQTTDKSEPKPKPEAAPEVPRAAYKS